MKRQPREKMYLRYAKCTQERLDCRCNVGDNRCEALSETYFRDGRECPFYKRREKEEKAE